MIESATQANVAAEWLLRQIRKAHNNNGRKEICTRYAEAITAITKHEPARVYHITNLIEYLKEENDEKSHWLSAPNRRSYSNEPRPSGRIVARAMGRSRP